MAAFSQSPKPPSPPRYGEGPAFAPPTQRARAAQRILAEPGEYKVCCGCGSICRILAAACPQCHAYRFDGGGEAVRARAKALANKQADPLRSKR